MAIVSEGGSGKTCAPDVRGCRVLVVFRAEDKDLTVKKTTNSLRAKSIVTLVLGAAFVALHFGCIAKMPDRSMEPPTRAANLPGYKVIFGTTKGKTPEIYKGQVSGNLTVQEALQSAGAIKRYKGMRVDLARRLENGQILKMPVNYDAETGKVIEEQNYAVHPGDEILVRREDPGMLHDVFKGIKTPL